MVHLAVLCDVGMLPYDVAKRSESPGNCLWRHKLKHWYRRHDPLILHYWSRHWSLLCCDVRNHVLVILISWQHHATWQIYSSRPQFCMNFKLWKHVKIRQNLHLFANKVWVHETPIHSIMFDIASRSLHLRTNFSLLLWKLLGVGSFWVWPKICDPITFQYLGYLVAKYLPVTAKLSPKGRNSRFSGFHGNICQFWWILVDHLPKAYLCAKHEVSSSNGRSAIMWVTNFVTELSVLLLRMMSAESNFEMSVSCQRQRP